MNEFLKLNDTLKQADIKAMELCQVIFKEIDQNTLYNSWKVLSAFREFKVSESHFSASTGYGYDDFGRDNLDRIVARVFGTEDALMRFTFESGTTTITTGLFGVMRPNDKMLILTGEVYDTLHGVLGHNKNVDGSLTDFGVKIKVVPLKDDKPDIEAITNELKADNYKAVYIQRSRGYSLRPSLTVAEINELVDLTKTISPNTYVLLDNCYGEFVEKEEPKADLLMGSLIKNPGGGIAPCGGYLAGTKELIEKCAYRMTAPGVGREVGATLGHNRELYMGFFNGPTVTGEALKTAVYASAIFEILGFTALPRYNDKRADIIESILLKTKENLIEFCKGIQFGAPVDSFVEPVPAPMPGYDDEVIMAAGAFTLGSSIELSADAPLREPYAVYLQGSLTFNTGRFGILKAAENILNIKK